jgi:hypothetical protein
VKTESTRRNARRPSAWINSEADLIWIIAHQQPVRAFRALPSAESLLHSRPNSEQFGFGVIALNAADAMDAVFSN